MAYGIIRVSNIRINGIGKTEIHNARLYGEKGLPLPDNIEPGKNERYGYNSYGAKWSAATDGGYEAGSLLKAVNMRMAEAGVEPRSNAVVAIEFVVSATMEFFDAYSCDGHFSNAKSWLGKKYGNENIIASYTHYDESTPHAHILVIPIVQKKVRWKNQKGAGERTEQRLCARDITGGKERMRQLQQDYHDFIKGYGANYGVTFYRGTKAEEQKKEYVMRTNASIGSIRNGIKELETCLEGLDKGFRAIMGTEHESAQHLGQLIERHNKLVAERKEAEARKAELEERLKKEVKGSIDTIHQLDVQIERKQKANKGKGWQKGQSF